MALVNVEKTPQASGRPTTAHAAATSPLLVVVPCPAGPRPAVSRPVVSKAPPAAVSPDTVGRVCARRKRPAVPPHGRPHVRPHVHPHVRPQVRTH
jgi:hypothetical protein